MFPDERNTEKKPNILLVPHVLKGIKTHQAGVICIVETFTLSQASRAHLGDWKLPNRAEDVSEALHGGLEQP